jgi:multidrug efflux system membrane fusion protein
LNYQALARQQGRDGSSDPVRVGLANEDGFPHTGTVDFLNNQLDASTGTIRVRAVLPNTDHSLTPGLFARVQLAGLGSAQAMLIDDKAMLTDQDRKYVYVVGPDDKAVRKDIVTGRLIDGLRVVQSGLDANDKVVVSGMQKIFFPGMPVKPIIASAPTLAAATPTAAN